MMQKALKAGVGRYLGPYAYYSYYEAQVIVRGSKGSRYLSISFEVSRRASLINTLIATKQPRSVIEMAHNAERKFQKLKQKQDNQRQNRR